MSKFDTEKFLVGGWILLLLFPPISVTPDVQGWLFYHLNSGFKIALSLLEKSKEKNTLSVLALCFSRINSHVVHRKCIKFMKTIWTQRRIWDPIKHL